MMESKSLIIIVGTLSIISLYALFLYLQFSFRKRKFIGLGFHATKLDVNLIDLDRHFTWNEKISISYKLTPNIYLIDCLAFTGISPYKFPKIISYILIGTNNQTKEPIDIYPSQKDFNEVTHLFNDLGLTQDQKIALLDLISKDGSIGFKFIGHYIVCSTFTSALMPLNVKGLSSDLGKVFHAK